MKRTHLVVLSREALLGFLLKRQTGRQGKATTWVYHVIRPPYKSQLSSQVFGRKERAFTFYQHLLQGRDREIERSCSVTSHRTTSFHRHSFSLPSKITNQSSPPRIITDFLRGVTRATDVSVLSIKAHLVLPAFLSSHLSLSTGTPLFDAYGV